MQLVEERGRPVEEPMWRDVVIVPAGGAVVVRIPFEDIPGRTVYHCHILDHEDLGMSTIDHIETSCSPSRAPGLPGVSSAYPLGVHRPI